MPLQKACIPKTLANKTRTLRYTSAGGIHRHFTPVWHLMENRKRKMPMSSIIFNFSKVIRIRLLVIGLTITLGIAVTVGLIWMRMEQVIAPPGLRIMDWLWRVFLFWCPG